MKIDKKPSGSRPPPAALPQDPAGGSAPDRHLGSRSSLSLWSASWQILDPPLCGSVGEAPWSWKLFVHFHAKEGQKLIKDLNRPRSRSRLIHSHYQSLLSVGGDSRQSARIPGSATVWVGGALYAPTDPQQKTNLVHFSLKIPHLVATILMIFLGVNWPYFVHFKE